MSDVTCKERPFDTECKSTGPLDNLTIAAIQTVLPNWDGVSWDVVFQMLRNMGRSESEIRAMTLRDIRFACSTREPRFRYATMENQKIPAVVMIEPMSLPNEKRPRLITLGIACQRYAVTRHTLLVWIGSGNLKSYRKGDAGTHYVDEADVAGHWQTR
jgi:hypothetical protein